MIFPQWIVLFSPIGFVIIIGLVGMLCASALIDSLYGSKTKMMVK